MGNRKTVAGTPEAVRRISRWLRSRSVREKVSLGAIAAICLLVFLKVFVKNKTHFYVAASISHSAGLLILIYKLSISKTCAGLSLKTQELTALYLALKMVSFLSVGIRMHLAFDLVSLSATLWVIYMIRFKLKATYMEELDNMPLYYVLVPCGVVAIVGHPVGPFNILLRLMWSFFLSVEAVAVLPQLRLIQNAKMVEPFTAHYVFALGVARFFGCANWIILLIETKGAYLMLVGQGHIWILVAFICEVVQTFILADFCYYYVKSAMEGKLIMKIPSMV